MKLLNRLLFFFLLFFFSCSTVASSHFTVGDNGNRAYPVIAPVCENISAKLPLISPSPSIAEKRMKQRVFTLLTWNSHKGQDKNWLEDFNQLVKRSDIVTLQEGHISSGFEEVMRANSFTWDMAHAFVFRGNHTGVLTASKNQPSSLCSFRMNEPLLPVPKTALITRYQIQNDELLVINVHMINFTLTTGKFSRDLEKIDQIIKRHTGPVILTGDFNTWNNSRHRLLEELIIKNNLTPVHFTDDMRTTFFNKVVDYVFLRDLKLIESEVIPLKSSDHNPILVTLAFPAKGSVDL